MNIIIFIILFFIPMPMWIKTTLLIILGLDILFPIVSSNNGFNFHLFKINITHKENETE